MVWSPGLFERRPCQGWVIQMFYRGSLGITHVVIPDDDAAMDDDLPALCGQYLGPGGVQLNLLSGKVCRFCRGIYFRNRKLRKDRNAPQGDVAGSSRASLRPGHHVE